LFAARVQSRVTVLENAVNVLNIRPAKDTVVHSSEHQWNGELGGSHAGPVVKPPRTKTGTTSKKGASLEDPPFPWVSIALSRLDGLQDLFFDGLHVVCRSLLHRRELNKGLSLLVHLLLHVHVAPELIHVPIRVLHRSRDARTL